MVAASVILLFGLYLYYVTGSRSITIKKGTHSPWWDFAPHFGIDTMRRYVTFTDSCYHVPDFEGDWSKLFGFSYGRHHQNSYRVGWRCRGANNDKIELGIYLYHFGERFYYGFHTVRTNERYLITLQVYKDKVRVITRDKRGKYEIKEVVLPSDVPKKWGYLLFPYFGGQDKAPHDVKFKFKRV